MMNLGVDIVALGVRDIKKSMCFYQKLGLTTDNNEEEPAVIFFNSTRAVLELYKISTPIVSRELQEPIQERCILSSVMKSQLEVDQLLFLAEEAGGKIIERGCVTSWGGYRGYFADPDNYCWAIIHWDEWSDRETLNI